MSTLELLRPDQVEALQNELKAETLHELASLMVEQVAPKSQFVKPNFENPRPTKNDIFIYQ